MNFFGDTLRNIKYGIKNIISWFPIIWRDRNWDHIFIFILLKFKLEKMSKYFSKYGHYVDKEKDVKKMNECIYLLNRLLDDNYFDMVSKKHDKKWGELKYSISDSGIFNTDRSNVTEDNKEQERLEYIECLKKEGQLITNDVERLFYNLNKHILKWWD